MPEGVLYVKRKQKLRWDGVQKLKSYLNIKRILAVLLCTVLLIVSCFAGPTTVSYAVEASDELPENIRIDKADFDTIPDVAEHYKQLFGDNAVSYFKSVNGESRIQRINFLQYPEGEYLEVNGQVTIDIPAMDARVWRLFGDVRFEGSVAQTMELYVIDPNGVETQWTVFKNGGWKDGVTGLYTNYTKMGFQESNSTEGITHPWLIKDENGDVIYDGYKMKIVGNGTLRSVYHWEEEGVPLEFDTSAWTVLGGDKEILDVSVDVDALTNLSMNGVNKLPEEVFKRYHVNSGPIGVEQAGGEITVLDEAYHKTTNDYGFIPGRGAFHYTLMTSWAGLKEDSERPGYADFTTTKEIYAKSQPAIDKFESLYPSIGKDYVLTLDGWPKWMWENPNSGQSEHFGTPSYSNFDAAADAAAQLIKSIDTRFDGLGPKYVEVKNESTIPQEWWFFQSEPEQAWSYLSEFHNKVAEAVKAENPDVLVGGPSSAFMYLEKNDFDEARAQLKFMDETKDSLDWYSHHFYENSNLFIHDRENNSDGFLSGRMEAVLDLLNAHMVNTDNVKPIYITEEGTYNTAGSDADYFQKLVAHNGYMLRFMNYSDTIGMLVPYLYPIINWRPNSNDTFYKYNETMNGLMEEMTPLEAYLDMWKDYRGAFLPSEADQERVYTNAVRYNDKVYVAVHNLNTQRVNLDLNVFTGDANIASVTRKHFFLEKGKLTYEEENVADLDNVYMRVQEMSVFEITLDSNPSFTKTWERQFAYAPEELVPTSPNAPAVFKIESLPTTLAKATLRIGFGKTGSGFTTDMSVVVNPDNPANTQNFSKDLEYTNKPGDLLTFAEFELDASKLLADNTIHITIPEDGGYITSVQMIQYDEQEAPTGVATDALTASIADAKSKLSSTVVSSTGNEVEPGNKWVKKHIHDTLNIEVMKAEVVAQDALATDSEINTALEDLTKAMGIFDQYTKTKDTPTGNRGAKISFEDGEAVDYTYNVDTVTTTTDSQGATDGSKALHTEFTSFTSYAWDTTGTYSGSLDFTAPEEGWSLGEDPFTFDVTNLRNYKIQLRVEISDTSDIKGTYYYALGANASRSISIEDFGVAGGTWLADGNFPRNTAIDTENIKFIRFYVFSPTEEPVTNAALAFDRIIIGNVPNEPTEEQLAAEAADALSADSLIFAEGDTAQAVTKHISLPLVGLHNASITWTSSHPSIVTNDGEVSRPRYGSGNQIVTLTATVTIGAASTTRDIEVTVLQKTATSTSPGGNNSPINPMPSIPQTANVDVLVDGKKHDNIAESVTTKEGDRTVTTITVDQQLLKNSLGNIDNDAIITIVVANSSDVVHGKLNGQSVKDLEQKNAVIELRTDTFSYKLPVQQINMIELFQELGSDVKLEDISIDMKISSAAADDTKALESSAMKGGFTVVSPPVNFNITYTYEGKTIEVDTFNTFVEKSIVIPEGVNQTQITTGVVVEEDGTVKPIPTRIVRQDGSYYAIMNSLTNGTYTVIWNPVAFQDVSGHWAENTVNDLGSRLIISGVEGNRFEPDRTITRAEFTAIVIRALGLNAEEGESAYSDIARGSWYEAYLNTATTYGLINGYANGQFGPNELITREQVMSIMERAMEITGYEAVTDMTEVDEILTRFKDGTEVATYAKNGIASSIKAGLVMGRSEDVLAPKAAITRAEVAEIVRRLLVNSDLI